MCVCDLIVAFMTLCHKFRSVFEYALRSAVFESLSSVHNTFSFLAMLVCQHQNIFLKDLNSPPYLDPARVRPHTPGSLICVSHSSFGPFYV